MTTHDAAVAALTPGEEAEIRERDSWCVPKEDGSWTIFGQSAFQPMHEHTEMALSDRRRLLATLDAERRLWEQWEQSRAENEASRARANSTDAAIAAVEAVLPKGWWLASMVQHEPGDWCVIASGQDDYLEADADTPAAALYALRDALARQQEEPK